MAEDKKLSPLELLDRQHAKDMAERQAKIDAATGELREAKQLVREATARLAGQQQAKMAASFAYDAARAELIRKKAAA